MRAVRRRDEGVRRGPRGPAEEHAGAGEGPRRQLPLRPVAQAEADEAPGGDNPTPDQDVVDDIGKAIGVQYQDNEELRASDKVVERDRHRWELDPASSEDYKDRK